MAHRVGIVGCGNISATYFANSRLYKAVEVVACADAFPEAALRRGAEFGVEALSVDALLARPDIEIVVNLTVPDAHYAVSKAALDAGKHVFTEKPLSVTFEQGRDLVATAAMKGLRLGSAPDTFLGGSHQLARRMVDEGRIGRIVGGTAHVLGRGMEMWHPNPGFFFQPGGGPVLDMGPYYVSALVNLIGPVKRVAGLTGKAFPVRTVTSDGPMKGQTITVNTPTTIHSVLEFHNGALVTLGASWDIKANGHRNPIEIYGTDASLLVPDPNFFGGTVQKSEDDGAWTSFGSEGEIFGRANQPAENPSVANWRVAGLADMASAIGTDRLHRCNPHFALHVLEVLLACLKAGETRSVIEIETVADRPEALGETEAQAMLA